MKKLMAFAMAAMVALASCTKTELVDNSAPTPISFKAVTGSMTKAPEDVVTKNLGVFAFISDDKEDYFGNSPFTKNNEGTWSGGKFWPIESKLDFVVYYPYQANNVSATYTNSTQQNPVDKVSLEVTIPNNSSEQTDYMYSDTYLTNKDKNSDMSVKLNHALSMIEVVFDGDIDDDGEDEITVSNVSLNNTYQSGTYNVSYTKTTVNGNVVWTPEITWNSWSNLTTSIPADAEVLVVPTIDATFDNGKFPEISFTYTMPDCTPLTYSYKFNANPDWAPGTHYIYTITITPSEIKFTPSVNGWATDNGSISIQG